MAKTKQFTPFAAVCSGRVPTDAECLELWNRYGMLDHIRVHSSLVAGVATTLAELARDKGMGLNVQAVRASALLHDLGKTYTVQFGGNHSQLGSSWVIQATRNPAVAQGVMHHVHWPGPLDLDAHFLPLAIIYADKRVKHESVVSLKDRFIDLVDRYGVNQDLIARIRRSFKQGKDIEKLLNTRLEVDLDAYPFDRRRMVQ